MQIPHKFEPREYQKDIFEAREDGHTRLVWVAHRRAGKDKTCLNLMIREMFQRVGTYFYFFPTYNQGRKVLWDGMDRDGMKFMDHFPDELVASKSEQEMQVILKNGSIFQIIGCDNAKDRIVGTNPVGVVFSEYPLGRPEVWDFIRPILAENGGWAAWIFTPRGLNHGWKILQQAKESKWWWKTLTVDDTSAISKEVLEEERAQMPQSLFEQEYYCKFIEGASSYFRRVDQNIWDGELWPERGKVYQIGVDLAKHQDWSVVTPIDLHSLKVGKQDKFQQIDYNLQKARIEAYCYRFNTAKVVIDSTGVGEPIYDDLELRGIPVESYRFTEKSKEALLRNLAILLEQDLIKVPNDPILLDQLRSWEYQISDTNKLKSGVPEGMHDDCVISLALAVWGIRQPLPFSSSSTPELTMYGPQRFD